MAFRSIRQVLAQAGLASSEQFDEWSKAWRVASENGSTESLLAFFARESGTAEDVFLQRLAQTLGWPYLDLPRLSIPPEVQKRMAANAEDMRTLSASHSPMLSRPDELAAILAEVARIDHAATSPAAA